MLDFGARHGRFTVVAAAARASVCLVVGATLTLPGPGVAAQARLTLDAPTRISVSDTPTVDLRIAVKPASAVKQLRDARLQASAGTIEPRSDSPLTWTWTPPAVGGLTQVTLTASAQVGRRRLTAEASVSVDPAQEDVPDLRTGGPFDLRIVPGRLILDTHASAKITIEPPAGAEKGAMPRVLVSAGRVSALTRLRDGRLKATYFAPNAQAPQAAIVAVVGGPGDGTFDWTPLPLFGRGTVSADVGAAGDLRVTVGERVFGPFRVDATESVQVPIVAPPGSTTAELTLDGTPVREIDLGAPPFNRLVASCSKAGDRVLLFVMDDKGQPADTAGLDVTVGSGSVSLPRRVALGVYESTYMPHRRAKPGTRVKLVARLAAETASKRTAVASCRMPIRAGAPVKVTLHTDRTFYTAGTGTPVVLRIDARDLRGRPARRVPTTLTADVGEVSIPTISTKGHYVATWTLPDSFGGRRTAHVTAELRDGPSPVRTEASVQLHAGRIAALDVRADDPVLLANGRSTTQLTITAEDAFGNLTGAADVRILPERGTVETSTANEADQTHRGVYTAPEYYSATEDTVAVLDDASDTRAELRIKLVPKREPVELGVRGGYTTNFGQISTWAIAADLGLRLGLANDRLVLGLGTGYSRARKEQATADGSSRVQTEVWILPVMLRAIGGLDVASGFLSLYGGVGVGASVVGKDTRAEQAVPRVGTDVHFTLGAIVGAGLRLGPGLIVAEVSYRHAANADERLQGNLAGLSVSGGYRLPFSL